MSAMRAIVPLLLLAMLSLSGCGGDDGGLAAPATTTISGIASKGPIKAGTVKVYAIRDGAEDMTAPIGQGQTDDNGNYSINVGSYKGAVMVEVAGGSYTDEVLGTPVTLKAPLRAVFASVSSERKTVAVTPLTELAYKKAKGSSSMLTAASIDDANAKIAAMFKLSDIVSTLPVADGTSDDQKKYAVACGTFSQLVNDNKETGETTDNALSRILTQMGDEVKGSGRFSLDTVTKINDAITNYTNSGKNNTGTAIPAIAPTSGALKLKTIGTANSIGAIDVTVNFPAGLTVKADPSTGEVAAESMTISGAAANSIANLSSAKFTPAAGGSPAQLHIILLSAKGFSSGEFATVRFDLAGGSFPKSNDAFSVATSAVKDTSGAALDSITAAVASLSAEIK